MLSIDNIFFASYFAQQIVRVKKMDEDEEEGTELTEEEILALCEGEMRSAVPTIIWQCFNLHVQDFHAEKELCELNLANYLPR